MLQHKQVECLLAESTSRVLAMFAGRVQFSRGASCKPWQDPCQSFMVCWITHLPKVFHHCMNFNQTPPTHALRANSEDPNLQGNQLVVSRE